MTAFGHSRSACDTGMADRTPNRRASYVALVTTERGPRMPDDRRLAAQLRMVEQFDGGEERVHVHVQDGGRGVVDSIGRHTPIAAIRSSHSTSLPRAPDYGPECPNVRIV